MSARRPTPTRNAVTPLHPSAHIAAPSTSSPASSPSAGPNTRAIASAPVQPQRAANTPATPQKTASSSSEPNTPLQTTDHSRLYDSIKALGRGAFGEVFLVKEKQSGKFYVIKKVNLEILRPKERVLAEAEVQILSSLKHHPHIVAHKESYIDRENNLCLVLQYCDGGDLAQAINRAKQEESTFAEDQVVNWICQLASALSYIHANHIVHRDLKTSNIFLTKKNIIKLGDFGISKILESTTDLAMTMVGTPYYMSPEVCQNQPYNQKSDVWALGCCMYEVCTLQRAFGADSLMGLVFKIVKEQYPPIPTRYSAQLRELIGSMMAKNPRDRPSTEDIFQLPYVKQHMTTFLLETQFLDSKVGPSNSSHSHPQGGSNPTSVSNHAQKDASGNQLKTSAANSRKTVLEQKKGIPERKQSTPSPMPAPVHVVVQTQPLKAMPQAKPADTKKPSASAAPNKHPNPQYQSHKTRFDDDSDDGNDNSSVEESIESDVSADDDSSENYYEDDFESESDDETLIAAVRKDYQRNLKQNQNHPTPQKTSTPAPAQPTATRNEPRRPNTNYDDQVVHVNPTSKDALAQKMQKMRSECERHFGREKFSQLYRLFQDRERMSEAEFKRQKAELTTEGDMKFALMVEEIVFREYISTTKP